jgi:Tol biopolymer transport system component
MRQSVALVALVSAFLTPAVDRAAGPRHLAFERDGGLWVAGIDGSAPKLIVRGQAPEISPDGTRLAYNTVQAAGQPANRQIAIFDLGAGTTTVLENVPSNNAMMPRWSPDGGRLLFDYYVDNQRRIGIINVDGTGFTAVLDAQPTHRNYWSATWAADGRSLFAQDMEFLYRLDLTGSVLKQWRIEQIVPRGGMGGDVQLAAAPDGRTLLMDVEMSEKERSGWDGPPPSMWLFDLVAETSRRLTPPTLYAWSCAWLDAPDSILFLSQARNESTPSIYRMTANGRGADRRLLVRNARMPSASR